MRKLVVFLTLILPLAIAVTGCKGADNDAVSLALLPLPDISGIRGYDAPRVVESKEEAYELLDALNDNFSMIREPLKNADWAAFEEAFMTKYSGNDLIGYMESSMMGLKRGDFSISINDANELKNCDYISAGTIKGTSGGTFAFNNQTFYDFYENGLENKNDSLTYTVSASRAFNITDGYLEFIVEAGEPEDPEDPEDPGEPPVDITYKIGGIINLEATRKAKETLVDADNYIKTINEDYYYQVSAAISVSDGTKGAKFRFSGSDRGSEYSRNIGGTYNSVYSEIEVYDNSNTLIFTLRDYWSTNWVYLGKNVSHSYF